MIPHKIMLEVVVRDARGSVIARRRKRAGYLRNFARMVRTELGGGTETWIDITGGSQTQTGTSSVTNPVIRVGSGSTPQAPGDYKLESELGTVAASFGSVVIVGSNSQFTISGSVTLGGGGTVREVAVGVNRNAYIGIALRDVVPGVVVPPGGSVTVTYTLIFTA